MAKHSAGEIMAVVIAALRGDATLEGLIGDSESPANVRVYDYVPEDTVFPYCRAHIQGAENDDAATVSGMIYNLQIDAFSRQLGDSELHDIEAAIMDVLHDASLSPAGANLVSILFLRANKITDPDNVTRHGIMEFTVMAENA